jgi:EAP30/Vps36 family
MCASIGVDPLASGKGFWSNMLDIGDFYYELAVQIVEVLKFYHHLFDITVHTYGCLIAFMLEVFFC